MSASLPANSGPLFNSLPAAGCRILAAVQVVMTTLLLASPASGQLPDSTASTASNSADIWICEYDIAADQSRRLFVVNDLLGVGDVQYGPGDLIAFDGQVAGRHATSSSHVFVCERDGSQRHDLGPGHKSSWSPRGRRLCVSRNSPEYGVWLLNADGQDTRLIDNRGWGASWSGGGQKIAYVRSLDGRANLVVWNLVEDELSALLPKDRIAAEARIAAVPRWSPDDARLACRVSEERGHALLVVTVSSQKSRVVWKGDGLQPGYSWQDESRLLVAIDDDVPGRSRLFRLDVDTGQTEPVPQQYPE